MMQECEAATVVGGSSTIKGGSFDQSTNKFTQCLPSTKQELQTRTGSEFHASDLPTSILDVLNRVLSDQAWCEEQISQEATIREACVKNLEAAMVNLTASLRQEIADARAEFHAAAALSEKYSSRDVNRGHADRDVGCVYGGLSSGSHSLQQLASLGQQFAEEKVAREELLMSWRCEFEKLSRSVIAHNKAIADRSQLVNAQQRNFVESRIAQSDAQVAEVLVLASHCGKELARLSADLTCRKVTTDEVLEEPCRGGAIAVMKPAAVTGTSAAPLSTIPKAARSPRFSMPGGGETQPNANPSVVPPSSTLPPAPSSSLVTNSPTLNVRSLAGVSRSNSPSRPQAPDFPLAIPRYDGGLRTSSMSVSQSLPTLCPTFASNGFAPLVRELPLQQ